MSRFSAVATTLVCIEVSLNVSRSSWRYVLGVQIQEEVLNELHRSQESAYNLRDAARQSHFNRAKLCSKIIKYPHVEDYMVSINLNPIPLRLHSTQARFEGA